MKKLYFALLTSLITSSLSAQLFTEISGTPFEGVKHSAIAFADIDNDNDLDVLITGENNSGEPIVELYSNDGLGNYFEMTGTPLVAVSNSSIEFVDIDNDNDLDLLITGDIDYSFVAKLYENDGIGNFTAVENSIFDWVNIDSFAFADIDNDNDQDVLIIGAETTYPSIAKFFTNDGTGNFTEIPGTLFTMVSSSTIAFADIDNDNDLDVLITRYVYWLDESSIYLNDGNGSFSEVTGDSVLGVQNSSIAFADIDNDNDLDVLINGTICVFCWMSNGYTTPSIKLYINDGNGIYSEDTGIPFEEVEYGFSTFADVDNDNDPDVLITGYNDQGLPIPKLYINDGTGTFTELTDTLFDGVLLDSGVFADIDNDNDQDLLITGRNYAYQNITKLYENNSVTTAVPEINPLFNNVSVYPNPNKGLVNVSLGDLKEVSVKVYNVSDQLIYHQDNINDPSFQFELNAIPGLYMLEINSQGQLQHYKLIKQ